MKSTKFYRVYDKTLNMYISTSKSTLWDSPTWAMHAANGHLKRHPGSYLEIHTFDRENAQIQPFTDFKKTWDDANRERLAAEAAKRERAQREIEISYLKHTASTLRLQLAEIDKRLSKLG